MQTIFISIAAYQDPQLVDTINNAIAMADRPERLSFGVALQYDKEPVLPQLPSIRTLSYEPSKRPGICRVRYNISKNLYKNEDFYLQIDSHYSFVRGWDTQILDAYYLLSAEYNTNKLIMLPLELYGNEKMTSSFKLEIVSQSSSLAINPIPVNGREIATTRHDKITFGRVGQILMPKHFINDVGLDPYSQDSQEIAYFTYRAIMSGYTFVQLHKKILWQNDHEYLSKVWDNNEERLSADNPHRFTSGYYQESGSTWHELSLAYIYNNYSKYAIKNAKLTPREFWKLQGQEEEFLSAREYFDRVLYSNLR